MTAILVQHAVPACNVPVRSRLERMALAATRVVDCIQALHRSGETLVSVALRGSTAFTEWEHYPDGDVYDPQSRAQYYFHAHPPDDRTDPDYGHFHTFLRLPDGGVESNPSEARDPASQDAVSNRLCHLVAISMSPAGWPDRLFTTNRWVTGETWQDARTVIAHLDRFSIDLEHPSRGLNQWLTEMLVLFRPQIEGLLIQRDAALDQWRREQHSTDVFEDRALEVTSSMRISLFDQLEWLDRTLNPET